MNPARYYSWMRSRGGATLLAVLLLAGCDSSTDPTARSITLTTNGGDLLQLDFTFSGADHPSNMLDDYTSDNAIDLSSFLSSKGGFRKSEILSARVKSAQILMVKPVQADVDLIQDVVLKLKTDNLSSIEVAEQSSFPAGQREQALNVRPNRNISSFVRADNFSAILTMTPGTLNPTTSYEISVLLELELEVEGI